MFRGINIFPNELENYEQDSFIHLTGFTSTSKKFSKALKFALAECPDDQIPVVFEIFFMSRSGFIELDDDITAYPGEQEVLLQDGLKYRVLFK